MIDAVGSVTAGPSNALPAATLDGDATRKLRALTAIGRPLDAQDPQVVREAATLMVSQLFFAPLLAEMREFPFGKELGHGGRMEEAFGEQLDQQVADAVAHSDPGFTTQLAKRLGRARGGRSPAVLNPQPAWDVTLAARRGGESNATSENRATQPG